MKAILRLRRHHYLARVSIFLITVALIAGMAGCNDTTPPSQNIEIRDWYDLDAIRDNLGGNYTLMNNLDSTTLGYEELASPTANEGKGWEPIENFVGTFDGQNYEIRDLYINRSDISIGLFSQFYGVIQGVGIVNTTVRGDGHVGSLIGGNYGIVSDCYSSANVIGNFLVGGLVGTNINTISNSYFTGHVTGNGEVGGLAGDNFDGTVSNSYSTGHVIGGGEVGGLIGSNGGTVNNSYFTGNVTGSEGLGGLVGDNYGTINDSYSTSIVTFDESVGEGEGYLVGGLVGNNRGTVSNSYFIGNVTGETMVGGLVGSNYAGTVTNSCALSSVTGNDLVGGFAGNNDNGGNISNCYAMGSINGDDSAIGGLVGHNFYSTVTDSYATCNVTGFEGIGGLVGANEHGTVSDSYSTGSVIGNYYVGGLVGSNTGNVTGSFWDTETSEQVTSAGGTGKTTAQMQDIATFSGATWDIIGVDNPDDRDTGYIWNIVDDATYPFLSWEAV